MPRPVIRPPRYRALLVVLVAMTAAGGCGRGCACGRKQLVTRSSRSTIPERYVDLGAGGHLDIVNSDGAIRVRGADVAQARVTGEVEGRSIWEEEARVLAHAPVLRVTTTPDGRVRIEGRPPRGKAIGASANLEVTVPRSVDLTVTSRGRGDVEIEGTTGPVVVTASQGGIVLRNVSGEVAATTRRKGGITISGAPTAFRVESGGPVSVTTAAPRLSGDSTVVARRGDVFVEVPAGLAAEVTVRAPRGTVHDDFSLGRSDGGAAAGRVGGGGPRLVVTAHHGDATLKKR